MEIILEDTDRVEGFCVIELSGEPHLFFVSRHADEEKSAAMQILEGTGKPRVIVCLEDEP